MLGPLGLANGSQFLPGGRPPGAPRWGGGSVGFGCGPGIDCRLVPLPGGAGFPVCFGFGCRGLFVCSGSVLRGWKASGGFPGPSCVGFRRVRNPGAWTVIECASKRPARAPERPRRRGPSGPLDAPQNRPTRPGIPRGGGRWVAPPAEFCTRAGQPSGRPHPPPEDNLCSSQVPILSGQRPLPGRMFPRGRDQFFIVSLLFLSICLSFLRGDLELNPPPGFIRAY